MYLNIDDSRLIDNPDRACVIDAVQALGEEQYAILTRDDDHYVQTRRNDDGTWALEYRDGSANRHFSADEGTTKVANVCLAFETFFDNKPLSGILDWERIDVDAAEPGEGEVEYNGVVMDSDWPAQIEAAQDIKTISIANTLFKRIPFGHEKDMPTERLDNCGDCGVLRGQLHVPECDIEQCPKCIGQLVSCDCLDL